MRRILITGGAGFVGRHFARYFLEQGDEVYCVDPLAPLTGAIHPGGDWPLFDIHSHYNKFRFYKMDCRVFFTQIAAAKIFFDYAFHLAAIVGGREIIEKDPLAVADDLSIDCAFWQWAVQRKPGKVVCFSSSAAYPIEFQGKQFPRNMREEDIVFDNRLSMPDMTYGWAKLTCEYLASIAAKQYGIKTVVYRPFSGYGEDQDLAYPTPALCKRVIEHDPYSKEPFKVWGSGLQKRDFIHIEDIVEAVVKTMDQVNDASPINLSTGVGTTFLELIEMIGDICEKKIKVHTDPSKPEGVFCRVGDTRKQKSLGIMHRISLKEGLERMLSYRIKQYV